MSLPIKGNILLQKKNLNTPVKFQAQQMRLADGDKVNDISLKYCIIMCDIVCRIDVALGV